MSPDEHPIAPVTEKPSDHLGFVVMVNAEATVLFGGFLAYRTDPVLFLQKSLVPLSREVNSSPPPFGLADCIRVFSSPHHPGTFLRTVSSLPSPWQKVALRNERR